MITTLTNNAFFSTLMLYCLELPKQVAPCMSQLSSRVIFCP